MKDFIQEALQMEVVLRQKAIFRRMEILMWRLAIFEQNDASPEFNNFLVMEAMQEHINRTTKILMRSFELNIFGDKK